MGPWGLQSLREKLQASESSYLKKQSGHLLSSSSGLHTHKHAPVHTTFHTQTHQPLFGLIENERGKDKGLVLGVWFGSTPAVWWVLFETLTLGQGDTPSVRLCVHFWLYMVSVVIYKDQCSHQLQSSSWLDAAPWGHRRGETGSMCAKNLIRWGNAQPFICLLFILHTGAKLQDVKASLNISSKNYVCLFIYVACTGQFTFRSQFTPSIMWVLGSIELRLAVLVAIPFNCWVAQWLHYILNWKEHDPNAHAPWTSMEATLWLKMHQRIDLSPTQELEAMKHITVQAKRCM